MKNNLELSDCIAHWITKSHVKLRNSLSQKLKQYNMTVEQRQILLLLYDQKSMTQSEICKETLSEASNITVTLKRMEQNGFIVKSKHPKDKRTTLISLTEKSLELEQELKEIGERNLKYLLSEVTDEEHAIALDVLKKIFKKALQEEFESLI